jgi:hypothetical protein
MGKSILMISRDDAPLEDVLDQQRTLDDDELGGGEADLDDEMPLDANPADVREQRFVVAPDEPASDE